MPSTSVTETIDQPAGASVRIDGLVKQYGPVRAVNGVSLALKQGEFLALLGPSGSGKTTVLMCLAGFERVTGGRMLIDEVDVTNVPPHRRQIGMVFQRYALFPHMSVGDNVAFPLRMRGYQPVERRKLALEALHLVRLPDLASRRPHQLSGGQQQRVALARAIVFRPRLLLMDEPLGALDKKLRERLQLEIKDLQLKLGTTVLYVTHDQHEALTMADRIAVMSDGLIQQVGTPSQLYETPANEFVADFVGETHFIPGTLEHREGVQCWISTQDPQVRVTATLAEGLGEVPPGTNMVVAVRPERVQIARRVGADAGYGGRVVNVVYSGGTTLYLVQSPSGTVAGARVPAGGLELVTGDDVVLSWSPEHARAYAQDGSHVGR